MWCDKAAFGGIMRGSSRFFGAFLPESSVFLCDVVKCDCSELIESFFVSCEIECLVSELRGAAPSSSNLGIKYYTVPDAQIYNHAQSRTHIMLSALVPASKTSLDKDSARTMLTR